MRTGSVSVPTGARLQGSTGGGLFDRTAPSTYARAALASGGNAAPTPMQGEDGESRTLYRHGRPQKVSLRCRPSSGQGGRTGPYMGWRAGAQQVLGAEAHVDEHVDRLEIVTRRTSRLGRKASDDGHEVARSEDSFDEQDDDSGDAQPASVGSMAPTAAPRP